MSENGSSKKPTEHDPVNFKLPRYKVFGGLSKYNIGRHIIGQGLTPAYYPGKEGRHPLLSLLARELVNGKPNPDHLNIEGKFATAIKALEDLPSTEKSADPEDPAKQTARREITHLREICTKFRAGTLDSAASLQELLALIGRHQQT
ncbi:MAG: hypothetical protein GKR77_03215, partial [Legionellales bacterium]|nr:hypothetical protein [Legionellales bacterium]